MSGKKRRMRERAVEDAASGLECEASTRDCNDLADLLVLMQKKGKKAKGAALEKQQKLDKVVQSDVTVSVVTVPETVMGAKSPAQKKKRKKNKKKATEGNTSVDTHNSQKQVENNEVGTDTAEQSKEHHFPKTESTTPALQCKKKRKKQNSNGNKNKGSQELNSCQSNNISNGQVEEEKTVITISDHSVDDPVLATPEVIDLTEDSILEDPNSLEPYNKDEITSAQVSMEWEKSHGPLSWFLQRLKVRNTAAKFVPRTSNMENEYYGLQDDFPMPSDS